jgi:RNA polymerase sigma-70 factor, ECF subfamily
MIAYQRINGEAQASDEPTCKDPDSELVVRAQAGDRDAFGRLVLQHKESISRIIFRITKNREDAEDEVQETFLRAYRGLREFRGNSKFTSWLTRIAVNRALMCFRKRHHRDISLEREGNSFNHDIPEWRPNPEQCYSQSEAHFNLNEELTTLPHGLRSALMLKHSGVHIPRNIDHHYPFRASHIHEGLQDWCPLTVKDVMIAARLCSPDQKRFK